MLSVYSCTLIALLFLIQCINVLSDMLKKYGMVLSRPTKRKE